jgi:hypothetical protein
MHSPGLNEIVKLVTPGIAGLSGRMKGEFTGLLCTNSSGCLQERNCFLGYMHAQLNGLAKVHHTEMGCLIVLHLPWENWYV